MFERLSQQIIEHEAPLRLIIFFATFAIMASWELINPCRELAVKKSRRWLNNISLIVLNSVLLRLIFPAAAVGVALYAEVNVIGVFNHLRIPTWLEVVLCVLILDFMIYWQHLVSHYIPLIWRFHRMHHVDLDFDLTTGARFHPIEIIASMLFKFLVVLLIGAPVLAVFIFEVMLNSFAMFNHSNISLPAKLERLVRFLFVTPDMHRIHHSTLMREHNSNYGFSLSIWDRLFHSYTDRPAQNQKVMAIGLSTIRDPGDCVQLPGMLILPFWKSEDTAVDDDNQAASY